MFIPNTRAQWLKKLPVRTIHGKESFAPAVMIPCGVVNLAEFVELTSVRADSSASRGAAEEIIAAAKILVPSSSEVAKGDVLTLYGFDVEITSKQPRINTQGTLDHYELICKLRNAI